MNNLQTKVCRASNCTVKTIALGLCSRHYQRLKLSGKIEKSYEEIKPLKGELWQDIKGFEGIYWISNFSRIKSQINNNIPRLIKTTATHGGYRYVILCNKAKYVKRVHRLVAETFIPNPFNLPQINHINGVKTDNRLENLEWCTSSQNATHAYQNKLRVPTQGEINGQSKLTTDDVNKILKLRGSISSYKLGQHYGLKHNTILNIWNNKSWKHIRRQHV